MIISTTDVSQLYLYSETSSKIYKFQVALPYLHVLLSIQRFSISGGDLCLYFSGAMRYIVKKFECFCQLIA